MPNRARSGAVSSPARVVAPISVNALQRQLHRSRAGPLPDHDVELEVLHRRVEDFLDRRAHPVDLVDEQHVARLQVGEDRREVARLLDHGAGGGAHRHAQLVADDVGERRLAEPGRAEQQHVIERLAALPRRGDRRRAGSRARDPGRCSRRACAAAAPLRTGRRRPTRAACDDTRVESRHRASLRQIASDASLNAGSNAVSQPASAASTALSTAAC